MFKAFKKYYLQFFQKDKGKDYGVKLGVKDYFITSFGIIFITIAVALISKLKVKYIVGLTIFSIILIPFVTVAAINQKREENRFNMVANYLTNIIPIFIQKPKILYALNELTTVVDDKLKETLQESIDYINKNTTDVNAEKTALKMIEKEFPNTRIISTNRMMLTIESKSSSGFQETCMIMYNDVENWINRVFLYQKELKSKKVQLFMLAVITVVLNLIFATVYNSDEIFIGIFDKPLYQISTTLFLGAIILACTVGLCKLNGVWIVNDMSEADEKKVTDQYKKYKNMSDKIAKGKIVFIIIMFGLTIISFLLFGDYLITGSIGITSIVIAISFLTEKSNLKRSISEYLSSEFPMWLRDISVSINNYTVLNSISVSINNVSYPLAEELKKFLKEANDNPTTIRPYTFFLKDYNLLDVTSSMKVLYSIQNLGTKESKSQINSLINRNQALLAKAEESRNAAHLSGTDLLGFVPMILFIIQTLVSMILVIMTMMSSLGGMASGM